MLVEIIVRDLSLVLLVVDLLFGELVAIRLYLIQSGNVSDVLLEPV